MSDFIINLHGRLRGLFATRRAIDPRDEHPRGSHKEYPRMPRIVLPAPEALTPRLDEALRARASYGAVPDANGFTPGELGTLLGLSLGIRDGITRMYPSGGARYPVETYLVGHILRDAPPGVYHYHPTKHALEHLWDIATPMSSLVLPSNTLVSNAMLVFTAVWGRASGRYGDWSYNHAILEAGHMAQNVLLVAEAIALGARPSLGFDDTAIAHALDLPREEQPIYSIFLAKRSGTEAPSYE